VNPLVIIPAVTAFVVHLGCAFWLAHRSEARGLLGLQGIMLGLGAAVVLVGTLARWGSAENRLLFTALEVGLASMGAVYFFFTVRIWSAGGKGVPPFALLAILGPLFGTFSATVAAQLDAADLAPLLGVPAMRWPQILLAVTVVFPAIHFLPRHFKGRDPDALVREMPWLLGAVAVLITAVGWVLSPPGNFGNLCLGVHALLVIPWTWSADRAQRLVLHPGNAGAASVRALQDALLLLNSKEVVDYANPAAVRLLGMDPAGVALSSIVEDTQLQSGSARLRGADGGWLDVVLSVSPIHMRDGEVGIAVCATDVRELKQALVDAQQAVRARQDFLAVMSHEIRTPINAVVGLAHLLESTPLQKEQRSWVQTLRQSADALSVLLTDILDISRIEAGAVELEHVAWSPAEVLGATLSLVEAQIRDKGIELHHSFGALPSLVEGDPTRVRQVMLNLLSNAAKFTAKGSVWVRASWEGETLNVEIQDTGIGIPQAKLSGLFEAFVQADASTTRRFGGTGLGLAISKRLVDMMQGSLSVESVLGQGSTFRFCIPLRVLDAVPNLDVSAQEPVDLSQLRVLVVEDNGVNRMVLRAVLARLGVVPQECVNGQQGLKATLESPFDVVIMDLQMPVMDGWEAMRQMRRELGQGCPWLIAHSANVLPEDVRNALAAGAQEHLSKPAPPVALENALRRAFLAMQHRTQGEENGMKGSARNGKM
jgi:signal transduction histidine kinase/ActR/RegA family two-component response regulator